MPNHWLVKQEPQAYSFAQLVADRRTVWDGVRNFSARNHLQAMKKGDLILYYHTGDEKAVAGIARVVAEARPDPSAPGEGWVAVEIEAVAPLARAVTLAEVRADPALAGMILVKQGRLSVMPVTSAEYARILELGGLRA